MAKKSKLRLTAALAAFALLLTSCGGGASQPQPSQGEEAGTVREIRIGVIYPLTGSNAQVGAEYVAAYKAGADIINNRHEQMGEFPFAATEGIPGLGGAKITIIEADSQGNPEVGATETERLITKEHVDVVMGCDFSSVTKTASVAAERLGVPFVNCDSTSVALTERGLKWFFRTGPHDGTFVSDTFAFLDLYRESAGLQSVAIVGEDTESGTLFRKLAEEAAKAHRYTIAESFTYPSAPANVTSECIKLKQANPDVILQSSYVSEAILFMKTYKEMDVNAKAIITQRGGFIAPEFFTAVGKDAEGIFTANAWSMDLAKAKPFLTPINELYKTYSGCDLTGNYARALQGLFVVADALDRAGSTDPEAIRQALADTDIGSEWLIVPWSGVKFDENHQNELATGIMTQVQSGDYVTLWPPEVATAQPVLPVPKWSERQVK